MAIVKEYLLPALLLVYACFAAAQPDAGSADDLEEQVLTATPAEALLAQAHRVVDMALYAHGLDSAPAEQRARLRGEVLADLAALDLPGHWRRALAGLPEATLEAARDRLAEPALQRLREAEAAPADAAQWQALRDYRVRLQARPPGPGRTALMERIVDAARYAELAALLQTGIERLVLERAAAAGLDVNRPAASEWAWLAAQRYASQRSAQVEYSFFSYRYLSNRVLEQALATMELGPVAAVSASLVETARERLLP